MLDENDPALEAPVFDVWRCIGRGRIEAPQPCIGVCEDRKAQMVEYRDYVAAVSPLDNAMDAVAGEWERSDRALQEDARRAIAAAAGRRPLHAGAPEAPDRVDP